MSASPRPRIDRDLDAESRRYPSSDGKPMSETDLHRQIMVDLIEILQTRYEDDPDVYVSGDLLVFHEEGNKRRHVSPDVFVVFGVMKRPRLNYLVWSEGKGPDIVIEVTSKTTRREDQTKKRTLYQDVLRVPEYVQIDPTEDYLNPPLQGHRLINGIYQPIEPINGRLPSDVLGLLLEKDGTRVIVFDQETGQQLLPGREEAVEARAEAQQARVEADRAQAEADRLRQELDTLRRQLRERNGG